MNPAKRLLLAIVQQSIRDYIKLDPESDTVSAEFYENEGADYKTAEQFIYYKEPIDFGSIAFTFEEVCDLLEIDIRKLKKAIAREALEY